MSARIYAVIAALAMISACSGRDTAPRSGDKATAADGSGSYSSSFYVIPPPAPTGPDDEIFATNGPAYGALVGSALRPLLPVTLGGAQLVSHIDGRYLASATYKLPDGKLATLDLQNTFHRGTHTQSLEELDDKSPRLCAKRDTLQGAEACIAQRLDGGTSIRWYVPDRIIVHLTAPTEALARELAISVPIDRIAVLSAAQ